MCLTMTLINKTTNDLLTVNIGASVPYRKSYLGRCSQNYLSTNAHYSGKCVLTQRQSLKLSTKLVTNFLWSLRNRDVLHKWYKVVFSKLPTNLLQTMFGLMCLSIKLIHQTTNDLLTVNIGAGVSYCKCYLEWCSWNYLWTHDSG
jgi:hypothetical protein